MVGTNNTMTRGTHLMMSCAQCYFKMLSTKHSTSIGVLLFTLCVIIYTLLILYISSLTSVWSLNTWSGECPLVLQLTKPSTPESVDRSKDARIICCCQAGSSGCVSISQQTEFSSQQFILCHFTSTGLSH